MAQTRAAIRYAKAVMSLANEQNSASKLNDDMKPSLPEESFPFA